MNRSLLPGGRGLQPPDAAADPVDARVRRTWRLSIYGVTRHGRRSRTVVRDGMVATDYMLMDHGIRYDYELWKQYVVTCALVSILVSLRFSVE